MSTPSPPPSKGWLADLISTVFAYIDRPWKAVVVISLFLVGGFGWVAYEKRDLIFESWLTPSEASLKTGEVPAALDKLATETDADLVQIWAVDLSHNSQSFLGARRHDGGRPVIPNPRVLPIFEKEHIRQDIRGVINVIEGHPTCLKLSESGSAIARRLADRGITWGCAVPIPPGPDAFIGVIYLAWEKPVDESTQGVALGVAREISRQLVTR